uniref:NADH-ubiquinone oxidoreductase chain 4 n=1 Tax=Pselaphinae sp. 3 EF-2015 TaxID=1756857 RepID=A0A0S2M8H7_9COLE|nr:NADH deshydrogenase subunit 4 [Pselaphinae sp. 3 EF-2015]
MLMLFLMLMNFKNKFWFFGYMYMLMFFLFFFSLNINLYSMQISYMFGVDKLSFLMIMLSFWICGLMVLASGLVYKKNNFFNLYLLLLLVLMIFLFCTFSSLNLFIFYLFFEMSLIPMLIMILGWGYQPERLQAGIYLLFYTLFVSLPMMISIFYYYINYNTLMFFFMSKEISSIYIYIFMNFVFFIKMPMFLVHLWLPKAHVEAPVFGSMILAGILLKLGGYGLIRMMIMFNNLGVQINLFFIMLSLLGGCLISLTCIRQIDMKSLVAYSSVAHMGLVMSGILTLNYWGVVGSVIMMLAHGLCSSGLFCLVNLSYERINSRSLFLNKGMINLMPSLSLWWFLFNSSNMAAPPSLNLLSEIMLINSLVSWSFLNMTMLMFMSFFSAVYSLYLYSFSQHGKINLFMYSYDMINIREFLLLMMHWLPLNLLILKSEFLMI